LGRKRRSPRLLAGFEGLLIGGREREETVIKGRRRGQKGEKGEGTEQEEGRGKGREGRRECVQ